MAKIRETSGPDYIFIGLLLIIVVFGLVMLGSASSDLAQNKFADSYYYLKHQLSTGLALGILGFLIGSFVYYRIWEKLSMGILFFGIILLFLVFTPLGLNLNGSERWIKIGSFTFQPGEAIKLFFLIYLSAWLTKSKERTKNFFQGFLPFLILCGIISLLLFLQPATTTAVILVAVALITYFAAGAKLRFLALFSLMGALAIAVLIYFTPYRMERITSFLNPESDPLGKTYQINQALISIGSGKLTGVGYGNSTAKFKYLPESIGDSIFAVIAEELGFVGVSFMILFFTLFIMRGFNIAKHSSDSFGKYLAISFSALIGLQAFINIGAISGILPLTGVPLPFVSYGGTALAVFLTMTGIMVNISKYRR